MTDHDLRPLRHELGTALNAILGLTESLREGVYGVLLPDQESVLQDIERSGQAVEGSLRRLFNEEQLLSRTLPSQRMASPRIVTPVSIDAMAPENRATVLVVDDDAISRRVLRDALHSLNVTMLFAQDGREAIALAEHFRPNVILLDLEMPELNGFETVRHIRRHQLLGDVQVIVLSAFADRENRLRVLRAGADAFVSKPFDREELRTRVATACRLERVRRRNTGSAIFEHFLVHSPDPVALLDTAGTVTFANDSFRTLLPKTPVEAELITAAIPFDALVDRADRARVHEAIAALAERPGRVIRFDVMLDAASSLPAEMTMFRGRHGEGDVIACVVRDMRARWLLQSALEHSQDYEGIGRIAAEVAHDVSSLLDVVEQQNARLHALKESGQSECDPTVRASMIEAVVRSRTMIRALLRLGRESTLDRRLITPEEFLREQHAFLHGLLPPGIVLGLDIAPDLPSMRIDTVLMERAIINLVFNARNALRGEGHITLGAGMAEGGVVLSVSDDGPGLGRSGGANGYGLGLGIVRRVAEAHDGRLSTDPQHAKGTRFVIWLPSE